MPTFGAAREADLEHRALDERPHGEMGPVLAEQLRHEPLDPVARHVQIEVLDGTAVDLVLDPGWRGARRHGVPLAPLYHRTCRPGTRRRFASPAPASVYSERGWVISHIPAVLLAGAAMVIFIAAVRMRLFGRVRHGFLVALVAAVAGARLVTAGLLGLWGFVQGERILFREFLDQMQTLGEVMAKEVRSDLAETSAGLERLAREISPEAARQNPAKIRETIAAVQAFDHHLLQVSIVDEHGKHVLSVTARGEPEPISRVGVAFSLEGKPFVSEAYLSPTFKRWVVALGVPLKDAGGAVRGAVTARYDVQGDFGELLAPIRFGKSGYVVLVEPGGASWPIPSSRPASARTSRPTRRCARRSRDGRAGWWRRTRVASSASSPTGRWTTRRRSDASHGCSSPRWIPTRPWRLSDRCAPSSSWGSSSCSRSAWSVASQVSWSIRGPLARLVRFVTVVRGGRPHPAHPDRRARRDRRAGHRPRRDGEGAAGARPA